MLKTLVVLNLFMFQTSAYAADKIRIGYPAPTASHMNSVLAQKKGFLKDEGIDAEIIRIPSPGSLAALVNGDIDYFSSISPVVAAAVRGLPVKVVACYMPGPSNTLVARPDVKSVKELKGKTVAVSTPGGGPTVITKMILKHFGLDPDKDVKLLPFDRDERRLIAMQQGLADAVALSPPFNYLAKKEGFVVLAKAYELFSYPPSGLAASVKKIRERPEEVKRVIRAGIKANHYIRENRDGTIQIMMEWLKINRELAVAAYESVGPAFSEDGNIPEDGLRLFIEEARKATKLDREVSINEVADSSILKEVQRELGIKAR
jgi:ABC-type nitrate/sulfonate/bicarbonate transport system substrate-binding protein